MAKGLRSSSTKANKAKLRSTVFSQIEDARTERLSAKLLELAAKPKEETMKEADVEEPRDEDEEADPEAEPEDSKMAVDKPERSRKQSKRRYDASRIQKKSAKKAVVFPVGQKDYRPRLKTKKTHRVKR